MPKIKTTKINIEKGEMVNYSYSTFQGDINLTLYYNSKDSYFYYDWKEINKVFNHLDYNNELSMYHFTNCKTEQDAFNRICFIIKDNYIIEKSLEIKITLKSKKGKETAFISDSNYGLNIEYRKILVLRIGNLLGEQYCDNEFNPTSTPHFRKEISKNIIPYSEKVEFFLQNINDKINNLEDLIYDFFNVDKDLITEKIINNGQLLLNK